MELFPEKNHPLPGNLEGSRLFLQDFSRQLLALKVKLQDLERLSKISYKMCFRRQPGNVFTQTLDPDIFIQILFEHSI